MPDSLIVMKQKNEGYRYLYLLLECKNKKDSFLYLAIDTFIFFVGKYGSCVSETNPQPTPNFYCQLSAFSSKKGTI